MKLPGGNHLDKRRRLRPRDYVHGGCGYGEDRSAQFFVPPGGDSVWRSVAEFEHRLIVRWREAKGPSGAEMARRYGFSKATWSRTVLGERWAGELVLVALLDAGRPRQPTRSAPRSQRR